jgi:kynurenine formamidase
MSELRFVDLSVPIQRPVPGELHGDLAVALAARIEYVDHEDSVPRVQRVFGCERSDLPDGQGWATEKLELGSHSGTHMDAPWHYFPTCGGQPARTIDHVPLEDCFGDGVVLDLTAFGPGERVPVDAVQAAVEATGSPLTAGEIVLLRYDADKTFGTAEYWNAYPGLTAEATEWIIDQGVRVIGTDAVGFDRDFPSMHDDFQRDRDASKLWEAHRVGKDREYFQIEKLTNLDQLPPRGFTVACFPIKITGASAGWVRAVAIVGLR